MCPPLQISMLFFCLGIMVHGELKCVGSPQHLKNKYGKGYTLTINMLPTENPVTQQEGLVDFIKRLSNDSATELSSVNRTRKFLIPKQSNVTISHVFKEMEINKSLLGIREWGLSLSTLEDVFISTVGENGN